ncbi:MAG TPA: preprotein translocase subunit SecE [Burkholderiales bacterium]|nr:preprotein translocase subunit SecE [Burkholderiales bacterium]
MTDTTENSIADKIKLVVALALVVAGIAGYYWLAASSILLRIASVVAGIAAGVVVAWMSAPGREFVTFAREAVVEVKKVVWPTRKETMQTTAAVFAFVIMMAVFLWVSDKTLEWVLYDLILGWKRT